MYTFQRMNQHTARLSKLQNSTETYKFLTERESKWCSRFLMPKEPKKIGFIFLLINLNNLVYEQAKINCLQGLDSDHALNYIN